MSGDKLTLQVILARCFNKKKGGDLLFIWKKKEKKKKSSVQYAPWPVGVANLLLKSHLHM